MFDTMWPSMHETYGAALDTGALPASRSITEISAAPITFHMSPLVEG